MPLLATIAADLPLPLYLRGPATRPALRPGDPGGLVDTLTGLATRRGLIERLEAMLAEEAATAPALILLDLDRFKAVNDSLGLLVGDALLCRVAQRIATVAPQAALLARISGDGFALLLSDAAAAPAVAAKLLDFIGRPFAVRGHAITVGASLGVAIGGEHGNDALTLLHAADLALHQAEREGRNQVRRFEPSMQQRALVRQALETDLRAAMAMQQAELRRALVAQQFEVHYQPQVALADGRLVGFEALVRWRHPVRGLVPPDAFIPLAEEIGLIDLLGDWVLRTACRTAAGWPRLADGSGPRIAVNVSPVQLRDGRGFLTAIQRALAESGLPPERLEIEITETALAGDVTDVLAGIRRLGVALALDDFGTGYSSLGRLRHHPFSRIKIDRSFVAGLDGGTDAADRHAGAWMIRAIASLGLGLGLDTVVEGIETEAQRALAAAAGCTEMQGYLVSRPLPEAEIPGFIQRLAAACPAGE